MKITEIVFWVMVGSLIIASIGYVVKAVEEENGGAIWTAVLCALAAAFSLFRELWLEPVLASGPAYLTIVSLAVLLLNLFLVGLAAIVCLAD